MSGKTVLVTGATDGIGRETALALARLGWSVVVHGRDAGRTAKAVKEIGDEAPGARVDSVVADFASLEAVRGMAGEVRTRFPDLDVLVNNAGLYMKSRHLSHDGHEMTFAVNHLAPFLLTNLLLDLLRRNTPARIVNVSSVAHMRARPDLDDLRADRRFDDYNAYAVSKLANVLFTYELAERLRGTGVTANVLHPGVIPTKLLRTGFGGMSGLTLREGAATSVYLAASPEVEGVSGRYFTACREASSSALSRDPELRRELWRISEILAPGEPP